VKCGTLAGPPLLNFWGLTFLSQTTLVFNDNVASAICFILLEFLFDVHIHEIVFIRIDKNPGHVCSQWEITQTYIHANSKKLRRNLAN
jgi:hypothetical protein